MLFNIISNTTNGAGLERDCIILANRLTEMGHAAQLVHFQNQFNGPILRADVNLFVEVIVAEMFGAAREQWLIPNPEWFFPQYWDQHLPKFHRILCKTEHAMKVFAPKVPAPRLFYIGFESADRCRAGIVRQRKFLHLAGKSMSKGTQEVIEAWKDWGLGPQYPLTLVTHQPVLARMCQRVPGITYFERLTDDEVTQAMNEHVFLVEPSKMEGFGHAICEATSCGMAVLTTAADPMYSFPGVPSSLLIPVKSSERMGATTAHNVYPKGVAERVKYAMTLSDADLSSIARTARDGFMARKEEFARQFKRAVPKA